MKSIFAQFIQKVDIISPEVLIHSLLSRYNLPCIVSRCFLCIYWSNFFTILYQDDRLQWNCTTGSPINPALNNLMRQNYPLMQYIRQKFYLGYF
jgi:hypothetical protein